MKKFRWITWIFALGIMGTTLGQVPEYELKSVYLFDFAKFVEWPQGTFSNVDTPFLIGVLGDDPFGTLLEDAVRDKSVDGHVIRLKRFDHFDGTQSASLRRCQILFIAYSEKGRLKEILLALKGASVLTVSEIEGFPLLGGMILFDLDGDRVTLGINPRAARMANLTVNSKLLHVAKIYQSE